MPSSIARFQQTRELHFITFSCYQRKPKLAVTDAYRTFEQELERVRQWYGFIVSGYVVMPEHVHLLVSEPRRKSLAIALQMLKQQVARRLRRGSDEPFWQRRYYDFNVFSARKVVEKLRYIHRNPVSRGLVDKPEDWEWSSFRHYLTGLSGTVEIESHWTASRREKMGVHPRLTGPKILSLRED